MQNKLVLNRSKIRHPKHNFKQSWKIGSTVSVGFLTLKVVAYNNYSTNSYTLTSLDGTKHYEFTPYQGLNRIN